MSYHKSVKLRSIALKKPTDRHMGTGVCMQLVTLSGRSMIVFSSLLTSTVFTRGFEVCSAARTRSSPVNEQKAQNRHENSTTNIPSPPQHQDDYTETNCDAKIT